MTGGYRGTSLRLGRKAYVTAGASEAEKAAKAAKLAAAKGLSIPAGASGYRPLGCYGPGAAISPGTRRKWIREALCELPAVVAARRAALALRRESLGKTYVSKAGVELPLNLLERERLAAAYGEARSSYHHYMRRALTWPVKEG